MAAAKHGVGVGLLFLMAMTVATPAVAQTSASIHSDTARASYCSDAQKQVGGTDLVAVNVLHDDPSTFVDADATPYDTDDGRDLPLTTHQLITSIPHPVEDRPMESVVSCKLKGGEAIQFHFGQDQGQLGRFCSDAHADMTDRVFAELTADEQARLVYRRGDVVMDPDVPAQGGGDWTSGQPQGGDFTLPQIAYEEADGRLHLRSKALIVPTVGVDIPPFVPRNKQGTHYCHLIAPDHLREIVTGRLTPCTADCNPAPVADPSTGPTAPAASPTPAPTTAAAAATPDATVAQTPATGSGAAAVPSATADALPSTGGGTALALLPLALAWSIAKPRRLGRSAVR